MKVLGVDDNELVLEVSRAALNAAGFEPVTSSTPLGFSAALAEARARVALIDVLMPALNGNHLVDISRKHLKRMNGSSASTRSSGAPECLLVLHSSLPEADLQALALRCGAAGFIRKSQHPGALGKRLCEFSRERGIVPPGDRRSRPPEKMKA